MEVLLLTQAVWSHSAVSRKAMTGSDSYLKKDPSDLWARNDMERSDVATERRVQTSRSGNPPTLGDGRKEYQHSRLINEVETQSDE